MTSDPCRAIRPRRWLIAAAALIGTACGGHGNGGDPYAAIKKEPWFLRATGAQPGPEAYDKRIRSFNSCAEAETYIEDRVVADLERAAAAQVRWLERYRDAVASKSGAAPASAESQSDGAAGALAAPESVTTGNDQADGVEEPDHVKTDGTHLYQISGDRLHIVRTWPADAMTEVAVQDLSGHPFKMLMADRRLVIFSNAPVTQNGTEIGNGAFMPERASALVLVDIVDVSSPSAPRITATYSLPGMFTSARRAGDSIRIIVGDSLPQAGMFSLYPKDEDIWSWDATRQTVWLNNTLAAQIKAARAMSLDQWLRSGESGRVFPDREVHGADCGRIHTPTAPAAFGLTRIAALDLATGGMSESLLLARSGALYSSVDSLYLATPFNWWDTTEPRRDYTYVHRFDSDAAGVPLYRGSGMVEGTARDQFAYDEHHGFLRVATTVTSFDGPVTTVNRVTILGLNGDELVVVGQTPDLAPGERIFAARYNGDMGYIVTFRQTDPLYTLDLGNPGNPRVVGELKVPGFSTYLHPIGPGLLLGIGQDADPVTGRALGLKLSVYDVREPAAPKELHTLSLGGGLWTDAQWDHRAFTWHAARGVLGIPTTGSILNGTDNWRTVSGITMFRISAATGIQELGTLDMSDIKASGDHQGNQWQWPARISRTVFADDFVYAVGDMAVRSAAIEALASPLATVRYTCRDGTEQCWWSGYGWCGGGFFGQE